MSRVLISHYEQSFVEALVRAGVRCLLVGGRAVGHYVPERRGDDTDLLLEQTPVNARLVARVLMQFNVQFRPEYIDRLEIPTGSPLQIPLRPAGLYVDLLTERAGFNFEAEWQRARVAALGTVQIRVAAPQYLIETKRIAARAVDLNDVALLELYIAQADPGQA